MTMICVMFVLVLEAAIIVAVQVIQDLTYARYARVRENVLIVMVPAESQSTIPIEIRGK